jgi:hypothetical protein
MPKKDMMAAGAEMVRDKMKAHASTPAIYRRADLRITVDATPGKTDMETADAAGGIVSATVPDFLIDPAQVLIAGRPVEPEPGDTLTIIRAGKTCVYKVLPRGETCFEWCDPSHKQMRVHTKLVSET